MGKLPEKRGLGQFADLEGGAAKEEGMVFFVGVDIPMHTMNVVFLLQTKFFIWSPIFPPQWNTLSKVQALTDLFINDLLFRWSPRSFVFEHPKRSPPKKVHAMLTVL